MRDDSQRTRKGNLDNESQLYQFLHICDSNDITSLKITSTMLLINFVLVHWRWGDQPFLNLWPPFLLPSTAFLALLALALVLALQLVLGVLYHKQLFFVLQAKVFRFVVWNKILEGCLVEVDRGGAMGVVYGVVAVLVGLMVFWINYMVIREGTDDSQFRFAVPSSLFLLIAQTLIQCLQIFKGLQTTQCLLGICLFLVCISLRQRLNNLMNPGPENLLCRYILRCHWYVLACIVCLKLGPGEIDPFVHAVMIAVGLLIIALSDYFQRYDRPEILFGRGKGDFLRFVEMADLAMEEAEEAAGEKECFGGMLVAYTYHHIRTCPLVDCPTKQDFSKVNLSEFFLPANRIRMQLRLVKKLDSLFQQQSRQRPDELPLKIAHFKLILKTKYKSKSLQLVSDIESLSNSYRQKMLAYCLRLRAETLDSGFMQAGQQAKLQQEISLFRYDLYFTLNLMMDFWSQFFEQRVDLSKLVSVSQKLFPFRKELEQLWQRLSQIESFSVVQVMMLYAQFTREILNEEEAGHAVEEQAERLKRKLKDDRSVKVREQEEVGVMIISLNDVNLGDVKEINSYAANLFGYLRKEGLKKRINDFMPKAFAINHDQYLANFRKNKHKAVNTDQRVLLGKHKNRFIFPIMLQLRRQFNNHNEDVMFMATIRQYKFRKPEVYCVIDEEGLISDMCASFRYTFRVTKEENCIESIIKNFWSLICSESKLVNSFLTSLELGQWGHPHHIADIYISTLSFPHNENVGYLLHGLLRKQPKQRQSIERRIGKLEETNSLKWQLQGRGFTARPAKYSHYDTCELRRTMPAICIQNSSLRQQIRQRVHFNYSQGIKTYRLFQQQMYRVDQSSQPNWQDFDDQFPQSNLGEKRELIQNAKQDTIKNKGDRGITLMKYLVHLYCLLLLGVTIWNGVTETSTIYDDVSRYEDIMHRERVQVLAAYFVTVVAAGRMGVGLDPQLQPLVHLREMLEFEIKKASLPPEKKERLEKLAFLGEEDTIEDFLQTSLLEFSRQPIQHEGSSSDYAIWILFPLGVILTLLIKSHYHKMQISLFQIFLDLDQKFMKSIYRKCLQFVRKLQKQAQRADQVSEVNLKQQDDDNADNFTNHKIKKLKGSVTFKRVFLLEVAAVLLAVLGFLTAFEIVDITISQKVVDATSMFEEVTLVAPESARLLMRTTLLFAQRKPDKFENQRYEESNQELDDGVLAGFSCLDASSADEIRSIMYSNMCNPTLKLPSCQSNFNGVLSLGGNQGLNLFFKLITELQSQILQNDFTSISTLSQAISLKFVYLKPLLQFLQKKVLEGLHSNFSQDVLFHQLKVILLVIFIFLGDFVICQYMLGRMLKELTLTRGLVSLIPKMDNTADAYRLLPQT